MAGSLARNWSAGLLFAVDLAGTAVFAMGGALAAIQAGLDLLGVLVLSFCTALGGGVLRDLLIGAVPPVAIQDWRYPVVAVAVGALTFLFHGPIKMIPLPLVIALDVAVAMGAVTGAGGGVIRDILLARVPLVLHTDIYATAAMAGAAVLVLARRGGLPTAWAAALGGLACFTLRLVAVWQGWGLPRVVGF
jgi:uncharacterized membrane protein YeiH